MAILIKNPEAERRARELAALTGETLTAAVDEAVKLRLAHERAQARKRPSAEDILAATQAFRRKAGLEQRPVKTSKERFDALWDEEDRPS